MAQTRVVKFARSDDEAGFVLLHAAPKGPNPLDLKLRATEGTDRFDATLKQNKVASLRVKNCPASESEWEAILTSLLNQEHLPDIQASATVQSESSISITVRKQIQGITQRLGAITLKYEPAGIDDFVEWCVTAVDASSDAKSAAASSTARVRDLEAAVDELKTQLDELITAKGEDEARMLQKFRDLLNEKKVKIRQQQKILASASFNASFPASQPSQTSAPQPAPQPARKPAKSRPMKRKAQTKTITQEDDEDDEDDGLEQMDIDKIKSEPEDTDPGNTTEATASITSDDEDEGGTGTEDESRQRVGQRQPQNTLATLPPPPPRALPFANKKPTRPAPAPVPAAAGSDSESDDEL